LAARAATREPAVIDRRYSREPAVIDRRYSYSSQREIAPTDAEINDWFTTCLLAAVDLPAAADLRQAGLYGTTDQERKIIESS
jgi:hypothetical protein